MTITAEQAERRRQFIGSSDAAAILGANPWATPRDVWLQKTGRVEETPESPAMALGRRLEGAIGDFVEEQQGVRLSRNIEVSLEGEPVGANIDAIDDAGVIWEIKTSGLYGGRTDEWGDPNTDQVPTQYIVQVHHQMAALQVVEGERVEEARIAALLPRRGVVTYRIPRNDDLVDVCVEKAREFWERYVVPDVEPDGATNLWALELRKRVEGKRVDIPNETLERYLDAVAAKREAEKTMKAAKHALLEALGDAEYGVCDIGEVSYRLVNRKEHICPATSYRALRVKEAKYCTNPGR